MKLWATTLTKKSTSNTLGDHMSDSMKLLYVTAHGRDCNNVLVQNAEGRMVLNHCGYIPLGMCIGGEDDLELTIDIETGTIVGWDAERVKLRLAELIEEQPVDEDE